MRMYGFRARPWLPAVAAALALLFEVGCSSEEVLELVGADVVPRLDVAPEALTLEVGITTPLTPLLNGSPISSSVPSWSSSDPQVATVDASGNVTCVGVGTATIRAAIERPGPDDSAGSTQITCVAPTLVEVVEDRISYFHTIGQSPCPDRVGQFTVRNRSTRSVRVQIDRGSVSALRSSVSGAQLQPGESLVVELLFDCSFPLSFASTVTVTATSETGQVQVETVEVEVVVQS